MQVRLGALLRMKTVLTNIAGRVYLANHATDQEAEDYATLLDCEALTLAASESRPKTATAPDPFPSYENDLALTREVLPGWMGVRYRPTAADVREEQGLVDGATDILAVYPDSPAEQAGLEVGDIVLGPPDAPFTAQHRIREWVMTVPIGEPQPLLVRRDDEELLVDFTTGPYPIETPALPGPPQEGTAAPQLEKLEAYRGTLDAAVSNERGYLLFFWATWCGPCKAAIPELLAFESERGTPVIAITDERAAQLEPFLETRDAPFPETVAIDSRRRAFQSYGVSGTPSFVLVDGDGTVQSTSTGYTYKKTGVLEVERLKIRRRIAFRDGRIVGCSSDDPSMLLGQFLISRGKITERQLRHALKRQRTEGGSMPDILVDMGVLTPKELEEQVAAKAKENICGLFEWVEAVFRFELDATPSEHSIAVDLPVEEILLNGAQRHDEVQRFHEVFTDAAVVLRRTETELPDDIERDALLLQVLELIDGERTLAEVILRRVGRGRWFAA